MLNNKDILDILDAKKEKSQIYLILIVYFYNLLIFKKSYDGGNTLWM